MKINHLISVHSQGEIAQIFVELDHDKPLVTLILLKIIAFYLEYKGLHAICFWCMWVIWAQRGSMY